MTAPGGISVALLRPFAELLGQVGAEPAAFLAALGVDDAMPPNSYVTAGRVDDELAAIAARRGDPAFALTLARAAAARPLGLFGHLVWLSGTVRDALHRAVKFWAMVTQRTTLAFDSAAAVATVRQCVVGSAPRGRILTEYPFASLALRARDATGGEFALRAVRFRHRGEAAAAYADVFRAPVTFGARADELEIDAAQLDLRLASADAITSGALEATVARLLTDAQADRDPFVARVRTAAAEITDGAPSLASIAKRLGVSTRTLRRHLEEHGESLRDIIGEVRRERADAFLAAGMSIKEIAFALGFSEPSAFSRAYKRWTGKPPRG